MTAATAGWTVRSIFHFTVNATSFERSLAFYTTLGFKVLRDNRDVIWGELVASNFGMPVAQGRGALLGIGDGPLETRLDLIEWLEPSLEPPPDTPIEGRVPRIIALRTDNVQAAYDDLSARGIEFVSKPRSARRSGIVNVCCCRDPDGLLVELIEYEPGLLEQSRGRLAHPDRLMSPRADEGRIAEIYATTKRWGRWGDDERGALNLLTPERAHRSAGLVRSGVVVSCGREVAVTPAADNPVPAQHHMTVAGDVGGHRRVGLQASSDFVGVSFHGMANSHIDALCHVFVDGHMYNGYPASEVTSVGARRNSIEATYDGIVGRGVLIDLPRHRGADWLEPGEAVLPDELEAARAAQGTTLEPGDIVLISTGRDARRAVHGPWDPGVVGLAGLDAECVVWLSGHDPSVVGSDGVSDVLPGNDHTWPMPLHMCLLAGMGVHLLDNLHLGRLAAACASEERWEFLFVVAPLQIRGGTGSPANPIAIL